MKRKIITTLLATTSIAVVSAQSNPAKWMNGLLVDAQGMTLYTFDKDANNKSNCNDACLKAWPALIASTDLKISAPYSIVTRDDGKKQVALSGKPLYTYVGDQKAGDMTGDKSSGVWHVVRAKSAGY